MGRRGEHNEWLPTPAEIAREAARIRAENEAAERQEPPPEDDDDYEDRIWGEA